MKFAAHVKQKNMKIKYDWRGRLIAHIDFKGLMTPSILFDKSWDLA